MYTYLTRMLAVFFICYVHESVVKVIDRFVSAEDLETKNKAEVEKSLLDLKEKMNQFFTFEGGIRRQRQTAVTTTSTRGKTEFKTPFGYISNKLKNEKSPEYLVPFS